jgi:Family of unknown function (DUF6502)
MSTTTSLILDAVLTCFNPIARLLVRHGVTYPMFIAALKKIFLEAAQQELLCNKKPLTDSAISLLSGVHRRDIRNMTKTASYVQSARPPISVASQLVARWMSAADYQNSADEPAELPRSGGSPSFDALAAQTSNDVRPRAILDELLRLGLVQENGKTVRLVVDGFVPKKDMRLMTEQFRSNLHDHIAAASSNLNHPTDQQGFLEQAIYVDELSKESAAMLHQAAAQAWRNTFKNVMRQAQQRFDHDAVHVKKSKRVFRIRLGTYFYSTDKD